MRPHRKLSSPPPRRPGGRGFTMIELMVVIVIIAILIGMLLPAIGGVQRNVRNAAVQAELNRIATAIVAFKTKYGSEPPSTVRIPETGGANGANWLPRDRAIIRQLWPQFNFAATRMINDDTDTTDVIGLETGEALVFFLGGLPDEETPGSKRFTLVPFSRNPQDPFSRAPNANREKSAYDFESGRLVDLDSDGFPEFLDSYPGQTNPILYFSSYDGNGYRLADFPGNQATVNKTIPVGPYRQGKLDNSPEFNKGTFQLISPGLDHEYGPGGPYEAGSDTPLPPWDRVAPEPFPVDILAADRRTERDNITNFGNGPLVP
ncbi:MAG: prepilin-type N-terminal cleavage/methylation domain-containing protein [Planctomycetaceae bacterium]|nr:prepilin-type N-terminal cleavage/methylation domain-containing protein [Planctomycetaceae bacterium]